MPMGFSVLARTGHLTLFSGSSIVFWLTIEAAGRTGVLILVIISSDDFE
jgi:hypothetical protein